MKTALMMMIPTLLVFAILPVTVGVYVWRDAGRRGMNRLLWTVLAIFFPGMVGFLIYLLVRSGYSDLHCPQCGTKVQKDFALCPGCGARFKAACPGCGAPVEPQWKLCPQCGTTLPEDRGTLCTPVQPKDKNLWKVLLVAILLPLVLFVMMGMVAVSTMNSSVSSLASSTMTVNEAKAEIETKETIDWLNEQLAQNSDTAAVLHWQGSAEADVTLSKSGYLVYLPNSAAGTQLPEVHILSDEGPFHSRLQANITSRSSATKPSVLLFVQYGEKPAKLALVVNDHEIEYTLTETETVPVLAGN